MHRRTGADRAAPPAGVHQQVGLPSPPTLVAACLRVDGLHKSCRNGDRRRAARRMAIPVDALSARWWAGRSAGAGSTGSPALPGTLVVHVGKPRGEPRDVSVAAHRSNRRTERCSAPREPGLNLLGGGHPMGGAGVAAETPTSSALACRPHGHPTHGHPASSRRGRSPGPRTVPRCRRGRHLEVAQVASRPGRPAHSWAEPAWRRDSPEQPAPSGTATSLHPDGSPGSIRDDDHCSHWAAASVAPRWRLARSSARRRYATSDRMGTAIELACFT